jgi:proline racemase
LRLLVDGLEPIPGGSMLEKRRYAQAHLDGLRRLLILEPRGHADMYGAIVTEPTSPDSDLGVLFLHNEGWSTMCGHGLIALVTCLLETGLSPSTYPGLDPSTCGLRTNSAWTLQPARFWPGPPGRPMVAG